MKFRPIFILCLLLTLSACARQPQSGAPAEPAAAEAVWKRYEAYCAARDAPRPYRLQASLRYGKEGDTRRVVVLLWGNGSEPLRLDVMAGVGVNVAKIFESSDEFIVYAPNEHRAYFHEGKEKPLLNVGVPVPFGVADLADALNGRFGVLFGTDRQGETTLRADGNMVYALGSGPMGGMLELNPQGLPVRWNENGSKGKNWKIGISYDDATPPLPRKLEITHSGGQRAILLLKEREFPAVPFTDAQLRLIVPEGTQMLPLRQYRR